LHFAFFILHSDQAALVLPQARLFKWRMQNAECRMPRAVKHQNLQIRTKQFALQVIKFCEGIIKDETSRIITRQLLRSGTSVGANYRAACRSKSKPTFISKMGDVLEEADESGYWVELLVDAAKIDQLTAAPLLAESKELVAIAMSSINTAKRNPESEH
jgi:four helix bundle protein